MCIKSKNNLKMHSGSGTPPLQSREKKIGIFFSGSNFMKHILGFPVHVEKKVKIKKGRVI